MTEFIHSGDEKKKYVQKMFEDISPRYDFLNHFLSFGVDLYWRFRLVRGLQLTRDQRALDVATGTGDVGLAILKRYPDVTVVGLDYAYNMTVLAREKARRRQAKGIIFVQGDGETLPFGDDSFDVLTISYGFRNIGHYEIALREFRRVLKPGGQLAILEFSVPKSVVFGALYQFYFKHILPRLAALVSKADAYRYLPESVDEFPDRPTLMAMLTAAGFQDIRCKDLTFGVTSIFMGIGGPR